MCLLRSRFAKQLLYYARLKFEQLLTFLSSRFSLTRISFFSRSRLIYDPRCLFKAKLSLAVDSTGCFSTTATVDLGNQSPIQNSHVSTHVILTWVSTWALNYFLTCKSRESSHENHVRYGKMAWKNFIKISFWDYLWIYTFYNLSITYIYKRNIKFRN